MADIMYDPGSKKGWLQNLWNKWTGRGLTDAQVITNAFNAQEAEKARGFEEQMSNTAYQRQVADMTAAGINPALAIDGSGGASTPSGEMAQAGSNNNGMDFSSMMQLLQLPLAITQQVADIKATEAGISKTKTETEKIGAETGEIGVRIEKMRTDIAGVELDNIQKETLNKYLDRMQEAELAVKEADVDYLRIQSRFIEKSVEKMDYEELEIFIRCCDYQEHINYLMSQQELNKAQCTELAATVKKMTAETKLINLNVDNFDYITVVGSQSTGMRVGPFGVNEGRPITLKEIKEHAEALKDEKSKNNSSRDWRDIKDKYPE